VGARWTANPPAIFVRTTAVAAAVWRVDPTTGARMPWKTLIPSDRAGIVGVHSVHIGRDGRSYAYSYERRLSELYLLAGLR